MDGANNRLGRRNGQAGVQVSDSTPGRKRCKFCRGFFTPNPNQARHDFCRDECRKNYHKYGALPLAKLKADLTRELSRIVAAELEPLRLRLDALERGGLPDNINWEGIAKINALVESLAKRGGGAAA